MTPSVPRDPNQLAKSIIDIATGEKPEHDPGAGKDPAAASLGRKGGLKGRGGWEVDSIFGLEREADALE